MAEHQVHRATFTPEQVRALLGGMFPHVNGFAWETVEYFEYIDNYLQPFRGEEILPGPPLLAGAWVEEEERLMNDSSDMPAFLQRQAE